MRTSQKLTRYGLEIEALEQDKLSSRLLKITHQGKPLNSMKNLKKRANAFLERVRYLEDELQTIEHDEHREAIVLRSRSPLEEKKGTQRQITYYEALLHQNGTTELARCQYQSQSGDTTVIDFVMTDRLLERLANDLTSLDA